MDIDRERNEIGDSSKTEIDLRPFYKENRRNKLLNGLIYIINIFISFLLGGFSAIGIGGGYPYFILFSFPPGAGIYIFTQVKIGKELLKKRSSRSNIFSYLSSLIGSLTSFILGVYYGLAKIYMNVGSIYGVYSEKKERFDG